jgi:hypothetical protein
LHNPNYEYVQYVIKWSDIIHVVSVIVASARTDDMPTVYSHALSDTTRWNWTEADITIRRVSEVVKRKTMSIIARAGLRGSYALDTVRR